MAMADGGGGRENNLLANCFEIKSKRHRVTLTPVLISWKPEGCPDCNSFNFMHKDTYQLWIGKYQKKIKKEKIFIISWVLEIVFPNMGWLVPRILLLCLSKQHSILMPIFKTGLGLKYNSSGVCHQVPLNEVVAVKTVDGSRRNRCCPCIQAVDDRQIRTNELISFRVTALELSYVERGWKHRWKLRSLVFRNPNCRVIQNWVAAIQDIINGFLYRPKRLLIFINPFGGKRKAQKIYENKVRPIFELAAIDTQIIMTERANHARDFLQEACLSKLDGVVAVGGDGMFSELLNGLLLRMQKDASINVHNSQHQPKKPELRIGIIPAGSTDAMAFSTTGTNDPITSALHILIGDNVNVDVCGIFHENNLIRYATTMVAYGYFGDVMSDSEKNRWLGTYRYDWAGFKKVLRNRAYEGEILFRLNPKPEKTPLDKDKCRAGCRTCERAHERLSSLPSEAQSSVSGWKCIRGRFLGINTVTLSCACGLTKQGVSPSAHLGDGCTDIVVVQKCSRINYLRFLMRMALHHDDPFNLDFVRVYRAREFQFRPTTMLDDEIGSDNSFRPVRSSMWNCDGELVVEPAIHVKVYCQLIRLFARGIEADYFDSNCRIGRESLKKSTLIASVAFHKIQNYYARNDQNCNMANEMSEGDLETPSIDTVSGFSSTASTPQPREPFEPKYKVKFSDDVTKDGDVVKYTIISRRNDSDSEIYTVHRQYEDFEWLEHCLTTSFHINGIIIPPLPPKPAVTSQMAEAKSKKQLGNDSKVVQKDDFYKDCRMLEKYLSLLLCHERFGVDKQLEDFLIKLEAPPRTKVKKGLFSNLFDAVENRKASHKNFNKKVYSQLRLCNALAHLSTAVSLCLSSNDPMHVVANKLFCKFSDGLDNSKHGIEVQSSNDENTLGFYLHLYAQYIEAEKEMLFRRTCLMVDYENANKAMDKAKPQKKEAMEKAKMDAEKAFEECSDVARGEIKKFHQKRRRMMLEGLSLYAEAQVKTARDTYILLVKSLESLKQFTLPLQSESDD
uniref:DAGKc domain-containing protein n=1 Tax=Strigamia maritima TaxID=126957 RepID=T1IWA5_STRMM